MRVDEGLGIGMAVLIVFIILCGLGFVVGRIGQAGIVVRSGFRYVQYHDSLFVLRPAQLMEAQATGHQQAHVASPDSAGQQQ